MTTVTRFSSPEHAFRNLEAGIVARRGYDDEQVRSEAVAFIQSNVPVILQRGRVQQTGRGQVDRMAALAQAAGRLDRPLSLDEFEPFKRDAAKLLKQLVDEVLIGEREGTDRPSMAHVLTFAAAMPFRGDVELEKGFKEYFVSQIPALIQGTAFAFGVADLKPFVSAFGVKRDELPQEVRAVIVEEIGKALGEPWDLHNITNRYNELDRTNEIVRLIVTLGLAPEDLAEAKLDAERAIKYNLRNENETPISRKIKVANLVYHFGFSEDELTTLVKQLDLAELQRL